MLFTRSQGKRTTCDCRQGEGDPFVQCIVEVCQLLTLMVPFVSVRVTNKTKEVISMFSGDRSRSLTLFQHCALNEQ